MGSQLPAAVTSGPRFWPRGETLCNNGFSRTFLGSVAPRAGNALAIEQPRWTHWYSSSGYDHRPSTILHRILQQTSHPKVVLRKKVAAGTVLVQL
jgi:hypothetical protein